MSTVWSLGAINMDLAVATGHHPAPGETVLGSALSRSPGGKAANQAVAARRAGARAALVARIGDDSFGDELLVFLDGEGVELSHVQAIPGAATGAALIVLAAGENTIVVAPGASSLLDEGSAADLGLAAGDVVLAQLEAPPSASEAIFRRARDAGATTVLNLAPARRGVDDLLALADVVVLNEVELGAAASGGAPSGARERAALAGAQRLKRTPQQTVVVTLGAAGAVAAGPHGDVAVPGWQVEAVDTTGAGDCFAGYLAATLERGAQIAQALRVANRAASLAVQRSGAAASMPRAAEVAEALALGEPT
jgi:ribokinase